MSGISAVSPPISAQPAISQPLAMPPTTATVVSHVQLAGGEIIEEEQRFGALHQHVVDAHGDQIDADGVVAVQLLGELQFGADAVGARDQHRLFVLAGQIEQRAEAAERRPALPGGSCAEQRLDAFDDFIAGIDIDPRIAVGQWGGAGGAGWVTEEPLARAGEPLILREYACESSVLNAQIGAKHAFGQQFTCSPGNRWLQDAHDAPDFWICVGRGSYFASAFFAAGLHGLGADRFAYRRRPRWRTRRV